MSLRKSPLMTPARLDANRRSAQKSTGPRTTRGKAQSRMNGLRHGFYSPAFVDLMWAVNDAAPCAVDEAIQAALTPEQAAHPVFAGFVEIARQAEIEVIEEARERRARLGPHTPFLRGAKPECY